MTEAFYDIVRSRRTVRSFAPDPVPADVLARCLEAARLAPSTSNIQPWEFVVIRSPQALEEARRVCLSQGGPATAPLMIAVVAHRDTWKRHAQFTLDTLQERGQLRKSQVKYWGTHIPLIYTSGPCGLFGLAKKAVCRVISLFRPFGNLQSAADNRVMVNKSAALAAATLMLALRAEGYDSCPMEGFDPWRAKRLLDLGGKAEVCMFLAVGKRSGAKALWWDRMLVPEAWVVREI